MRIIQSAWACNNSNLLTTNSGWLAPEYNLMSWTLSCLQLKKHYAELILHCDSVYAKLLIDTLQLPYSNVVCDLDNLNNYHSQLWALPKIHSYSKQEKPFLHVDGDVFIWKKFDDDLVKGDLIAQNIETATEYYENIMRSLEFGLNYFPPEIISERRSKMPMLAYNAGIFGGNDIAFFKEYTSKAFKFVDRNLPNLSNINVTNFNIFFEQYLFYCLVKKNKKQVNVLISEPIEDNRYRGFADFARVPYEKDYLHLLGAYKRNEFVCAQMADRLRQDYPIYYYRIIELMKKNKIPLFKDCYNHLEKLDEKYLVKRYHILKNDFLNKEKFQNLEVFESSIEKKVSYSYFVNDKQILSLDPDQLEDLQIFVFRLNEIRDNKFSNIARDFLYGRDCNSNYYYEYLFGNRDSIYEKKIIASENFELLETRYNWCLLREQNRKGFANVKLFKTNFESKIMVTPECNNEGFSATAIDSLDVLLLEILSVEKTIQEVLDEIKEYFDEEELKKSSLEFEKLIFGRLKSGLHTKSIKVIFLNI
ncbi:DUF6734 family protein [Flavobacterium sp. KACC 22761]|uniref:DUF6734 family protein n=1 Tax=Flavobacterium sp. KACC 22761 TaxID=3092665 RepID=UPI002A75701A|nr:DUF6734 family protein [Flavobacterium sp. KACC 22761]WPO77290.1 DUF6734 family protein [Flavobacterium sp. KACC 22761]